MGLLLNLKPGDGFVLGETTVMIGKSKKANRVALYFDGPDRVERVPVIKPKVKEKDDAKEIY